MKTEATFSVKIDLLLNSVEDCEVWHITECWINMQTKKIAWYKGYTVRGGIKYHQIFSPKNLKHAKVIKREVIVNENIVNDLLLLCNKWFVNPWVQPYAGANPECMFCGCLQTKEGGSHHSATDCPVILLQDIIKQYSKKGGKE